MPSGKVSPVRVDAPSLEFSQLAMQELELDDVKRRYIRAVYFWTKSVSRTAKILKVARNTVQEYIG